MSTLSIPVPSDLEKFIERMVKEGRAANKADVVRRALRIYAETEVIDDILRAQKEPSLRGNARDLMKKIK